MSISHPLLKKLKNDILALYSSIGHEVLDDHPSLALLCQTLEEILRLGLVQSRFSVFGLLHRDYWHVAETVAKIPGCSERVCEAVEAARLSERVRTGQGRGRLFIRLCLVKHCLHSFHTALRNSAVLSECYHGQSSILGCEIISEILHSLLLQIDAMKFRLNSRNSAFLDVSWLLPVYRQYELVPCDDLGMKLTHIDSYVVVTDVNCNSPAADEDRVEVGDVLDQLYGHCLHCTGRVALLALVRNNRSRPLHICVLKCHSLTGDFYPPIIPLLTRLNLDLAHLGAIYRCRAQSRGDGVSPVPPGSVSENYKTSVLTECVAERTVVYLGVSFVGDCGNVSVIDLGIDNVLKQLPDPQPVEFVFSESGVCVVDSRSTELLFRHSFTQIASCGSLLHRPTHFAYVAGNMSCNLTQHFYCYTFMVNDQEIVSSILQSLAQGFQRTQFTV